LALEETTFPVLNGYQPGALLGGGGKQRSQNASVTRGYFSRGKEVKTGGNGAGGGGVVQKLNKGSYRGGGGCF